MLKSEHTMHSLKHVVRHKLEYFQCLISHNSIHSIIWPTLTGENNRNHTKKDRNDLRIMTNEEQQ